MARSTSRTHRKQALQGALYVCQTGHYLGGDTDLAIQRLFCESGGPNNAVSRHFDTTAMSKHFAWTAAIALSS